LKNRKKGTKKVPLYQAQNRRIQTFTLLFGDEEQSLRTSTADGTSQEEEEARRQGILL
jgi:hypothetical protein